MSPITGLLPGHPAESLRPRLRRDRHDPTGRTSQIHRNPRTTDPRRRQLPGEQQLQLQVAVGVVRLRPPLAPPLRRRLRRVGEMSTVAGALDLLDHEAPTGRPLQRELRLAGGEASEPLTYRLTHRRADPAAPNLASRQLDRLERDLPAVHIQSAYDLHRDLLELHGLERPACLPRLSRGGPTTCHLYGAPWSQPVATGRKSPGPENRQSKPKPLP